MNTLSHYPHEVTLSGKPAFHTTEPTAMRTLIIAARANDMIVSRLINGACEKFASVGISPENQSIIRVPGALEIPVTLKKAARTGLFDAFVVLGAVIKGQTDHYHHVARLVNDGVQQVTLELGLALGNGVLTVHSLEQAIARADGPSGNLGADAAAASINLRHTFNTLDSSKQ